MPKEFFNQVDTKLVLVSDTEVTITLSQLLSLRKKNKKKKMTPRKTIQVTRNFEIPVLTALERYGKNARISNFSMAKALDLCNKMYLSALRGANRYTQKGNMQKC